MIPAYGTATVDCKQGLDPQTQLRAEACGYLNEGKFPAGM
jgi:hypothetical protein